MQINWLLNIGWISVNDRLPLTDDTITQYWVYTEFNTFIAYYWGGDWTNADTWYDFDNEVKYWRKAKVPKYYDN